MVTQGEGHGLANRKSGVESGRCLCTSSSGVWKEGSCGGLWSGEAGWPKFEVLAKFAHAIGQSQAGWTQLRALFWRWSDVQRQAYRAIS